MEQNKVLVRQNGDLIQRIEATERRVSSSPHVRGVGDSAAGLGVFDAHAPPAAALPHSKRRVQGRSLKAAWYEWHSMHQWEERDNRQRHHDHKVVVAYMKRFLPNGYDLTSDNVLELGELAEQNVIDFLATNHSRARSCGLVVVALKRFTAAANGCSDPEV